VQDFLVVDTSGSNLPVYHLVPEFSVLLAVLLLRKAKAGAEKGQKKDSEKKEGDKSMGIGFYPGEPMRGVFQVFVFSTSHPASGYLRI
jgi:hypothetical protein